MKQRFFHNSQVETYRAPFGAVLCGSAVTLRLTAAADSGAQRVELCLFQDGERICQEMQPGLGAGGERQYEYRLTVPEEPCLLWYFFQIHTAEGLLYYGNNRAQEGGPGDIYYDNPVSYQITVHNNEKPLPDWFRQGIVYQIFVDRFNNGMPDGRILSPKKGCLIHPHWDDDPIYVRERETGRILAYDFFGGNLDGVLAKLPYLAELGVSAIYLNPVFESPSNHKYDTADYKEIDAMFGTLATFRELCAEAKRRGIAVILDGVFSHTGSDSVYFNKLGNYPGTGAFQSPESPYYPWFRFHNYPHEYASWWGIDTMPEVDELEPSYLDFAVREPDSVIRYWMSQGAKGWRLDVADELPDLFIKELHRAVKETDPEGVVIGEVWEDASNKTSYNQLRQYLGGDELDSVTNYPFRNVVLDFLLGRQEAAAVSRKLMNLCENYPKTSFYGALNLLGTHDVARVLTVLQEGAPAGKELQLARQRLKLAALWQMTFPGVPCIYYGDEAGLTGGSDPQNRRTFPWGREDPEILAWYKAVTAARRKYSVLTDGEWQPLELHPDVFGYVRTGPDNTAVVLVNRAAEERWVTTTHPLCRGMFFSLLEEERETALGTRPLRLGPLEGKLLLRRVDTPPRDCGILLHLTALASEHGIGDMGEGARSFIDFLSAAKQSYWQILPFNPPGDGNSPYNALSAFAGNPLLLAPDMLVRDGFVAERDVEALRAELSIGAALADKVDFALVKEYKEKLLRLAFASFGQTRGSEEWRHFCRENAFWLDDFALFMAIKEHHGLTAWTQWPEELRRRRPKALAAWTEKLAGEIEYQSFVQFLFWRQWQELLEYAHARRIKLIGDLPIFVSYDSADVWSQPQLFDMDEAGHPKTVAGVPPDYFSETGQLWGNPLYDWEAAARDDYLWWRQRLSFLLRQVDVIRVDHFRGFEAFWSIPAQAETAREGEWVKGPGLPFFQMLKEYLGELPIIAEDLGAITQEVIEMKQAAGFPGMKVLHFLFGWTDRGECAPLGIDHDCIVYPGTHDNDTTAGWYGELELTHPGTAECLKQYLGLGAQPAATEVAWRLNELAYQSKARTAMLALQDVLTLDTEARMNVPGTVGDGNWSWRCRPGLIDEALAEKLAAMVLQYKRGREQ